MANKTKATLELTGMEDLYRNLARLDGATSGRVLENAVRDGAKVLRDEMRRRAPRSSKPGGTRGRGHAADHIKTEVRTQVSPLRAYVNVGPPKWGWYLSFAEFSGGGAHTIMPDDSQAIRIPAGEFAAAVSHPGHPARPWFRPSVDSRKRNVNDTIRRSLAARIRIALR